MIEYIGNGSIIKLKYILKNENLEDIFLITGTSKLELKNINRVKNIIEKYSNFFHFNEIEPIPSVLGIEKALNSFKKKTFDAIIALGGGSVLDIGKCVSIFSTNKGKIEDYLLKNEKIRRKGTFLVLIPTTSGTGSEATHFAVIFIDKTKYSLADPIFISPDYSIVDPELTHSLPKKVTAYTGMDALCQAIESFWNVNSTDESKNYAKKAIQLILKNLLKAVHNPDKKSRYNMAIAAHFSGKAINITKTTACHAISYPITSYFNVPHGHAVALTLPSMLIFNSNVNEKDINDFRGVKFVKMTMKELISILGVSNFTEAKDKIKNLIINIGLETNLGELGIKTPDDIEIVIKNGFNPERVKNNPRLLTETQLRRILEDIK